jgi:hypothetical protein
MDQKLLEALGCTFTQFSTGGTSERLFQDMSWDALTSAFATSRYFHQQGNTSAKKNPPFTAYDVQLHRGFRNFLQKVNVRMSDIVFRLLMRLTEGENCREAYGGFKGQSHPGCKHFSTLSSLR